MVKYLINTGFIFVVLVLFVSCVDTDKSIKKAETFKALPLLHVQPEFFYLGDIKEGETGTATFLIRNNSAQAIYIVDIQASCGCTAAEPESYMIMPGSFTPLKVVVDTTAKQNGIRKMIHITDSSGQKASAILTFNVVENPHASSQGKIKGIFDGKCASCHFDPLLTKKSGADIYRVGCAMCHGADAVGGYAPDLRGFSSLAALKERISKGVGRPQMPGFAKENGGPLSQEQVAALAEWLMNIPAQSQ